MRNTILLFLFLIVSFASMNAQRTITGKVTDADGEDLPGVTVLAKGTTVATITDLTGTFNLTVPDTVQVIVFKFIGYNDQERPISDVMNITMAEATELEEVVVTALGIERNVKALGYSTTSVGGDEISETRNRSALNALQGKVAGVNISSASSAPGSSTRIILRGFSSITGENQPLFVIDGVPVDNTRSGSTSINGGTDFGNGINDINPDDIETINILKGASGSALYGSRAANGVIIITTKSGKQKKDKKGLEITVNSSARFESILRLPDWQSTYGQGFFGLRDIRENTSWGPRFDDEMRYWGYEIDGVRKIKPYSDLPENVLNFFEIGHQFNNSIALAGGNENATFYTSYANNYSDGIMPQDHDIYNRHNLKISGEAKLSNNFSFSGDLNYLKKQSSYVSTGQGSVSVYNQILQIPRDIPITELEDYEDPMNNLDNFYSAYMVNPYYVLNEYGNFNNQDRIYGNAKIQYIFSDNLNAFFRVGSDITNEQRHEHQPIIDPGGINDANESWVNTNEGSVAESSRFRRQINTDFIVTYNRQFTNFDFNVMLGHNMFQSNNKTIYQSVTGLDIPGYYNLANSGNIPLAIEGESLRRLIGVYVNADFSFYNMIFLTTTLRRDWSSTLPYPNNSYYYPGVNASVDLTTLVPAIKGVFDFAKLRAGWARVGRDAEPYQVYSTLVQAGFYNGYEGTNMVFPMADGLNAYTLSNLIGNPELSPEFVTEFEVGTDLRFFDGRVVLDFTYYDKITTDLIFQATLPYSSGFPSQTINFGKIENKGFESLLTVFPIRKDDFEWKLNFTFSKNYCEVLELPESLMNSETGEREYTITGFGMPATGYTSFTVFEGDPLAVFTVNDVERVKDEASPYYGYIVVDSNTGLPLVSNDVIKLGDSNYDFMLGLGSNLSYKNISFSFTIDIRQGGLMYSRTAEMTYFSGTNHQTTFNDRQPFVIPNSVVEVKDVSGNVIGYEENDLAIINNAPNGIGLGANMHEYWGNGGEGLNSTFVIDKSFIKLRDVSLAYTLPKKWLKNTFIGSLSVSVVGNNLLLFTPEENRWIDPETTSFGNDLEADFGEYGTNPSIRSLGFNLKFTF